MKLTIVLLLTALAVSAQIGTVTVNTTVTAVASQSATDTNAVTCTAVPASGQIAVTCKVGTATGLSATYTIIPNSTATTNAALASYSLGNNSVTWLLYQPLSTGPITWQVAANGIMKSGQF